MDGWTNAKLHTIAEVRVSNVDKKTYSTETPVKLCNYMDVYSNDYITALVDFMNASASKAEIDRFTLHAGDVVITKDSETPDDIGIPAVVTESIEGLVCGYHLAVIRPYDEAIDSIYLAKQLSSSPITNYFAVNANGSTRFALSVAAIEGVTIPHPPLPEQTKIADVLSTVDRAIKQTEVLIAKQQRIKTGLMQDLLTRGIDEDGNLRSEETHEFKDSLMGRIPVEWTVGGFEDYVDKDAGIKPGPFGSSLTKDMYTNTGFRVYGQEQVIGGNLDNGDYYISKRKYNKMLTFAVTAGDVLISLVGTIGHVLIVPDDYHPGVINPRLLRFRPNQDVCYPYFLRVILLSQPIRNQLDALATGGTMPVLSAGIIRSLLVVIVDKMEQERVGVILGQIEKYLSSHLKRLRKLCSLKTALMQDLLNGIVSVTPLLTEQEEAGA